METKLAITETRSSSAWLWFDPAANMALRQCGGFVERRWNGSVQVLREPLPPPLRQTLERRRDELETALAPAPLGGTRRMVAALFLVIPEAKANEDALSAILDAYAYDLSSEPLFAIATACRAVKDSGVRFRPGLPELLALARKSTVNLRDELAKIKMALTAEVLPPPPSAEDRARVLAVWEATRRRLSLGKTEAR